MSTEREAQEAAAAATAAGAPAAEPPADGAAAAQEPAAEELPELPLFSCKEAYVYRVPAATTAGHRAESWDVNQWLVNVRLKVVQADDDAYIRLLEEKTGELFAECPVPTDKPLVTAVEPVVDSSRYFVLRIVDRDSQRHAFIGIGFRERSEASDFNAALHEFLQYIKRKRTAEAMRHAYEERLQTASSADVDGGSLPGLPAADYSIKEGETLTLKISAPRRAGSGGFVSNPGRGLLNKQFSLVMGEQGGTMAALSPPPAGSLAQRSPNASDMCVSPAADAGRTSPQWEASDSGGSGGNPGPFRVSGSGDAELPQRLQGLRLQQAGEAGPPSGSTSAASGSPAAVVSAAETDEDDFGEFEGA